MFQFEIDLRPGAEAERFNTAVYRFLELRAEGLDGLGLVKIDTLPDGQVEKKTVTLWSPEAVDEFQRFWAKAKARL
jgi:hypothetical protein